MKIEFVSHAGFILEVNGKKIFCDPWLVSKTFNDSWNLYCGDILVDYSKVDYIFISHEHPDHLNFPTLKAIPEIDKQRITILYQKHASLRVYNALRKLGFTIIQELNLYQWIRLDELELYCGSAGSLDSFFAVRGEGKTILNMNDCVFNNTQHKYIKRQIGEIDYLFTQFSFANWVGNEIDQDKGAYNKILQLKTQNDIYKPKFLIPSASFVYFCRHENWRMNAWSNTPKIIHELKIPNLKFMTPNEIVDAHKPVFNSQKAVDWYMQKLSKIEPIGFEELHNIQEITFVIEENIKKFQQKIPKIIRFFVKPFIIFIQDLNVSICIDAGKGLVIQQAGKMDNYRYEMTSQVCYYTFRFSWGTGTLFVSGMYYDRFYPIKHSKYFFIQNVLSTEILKIGNFKEFTRVFSFFWAKKQELIYRFFG